MPKLTAHEIRAVAVQAYCDPRTVRRFLAGHEVTSTCRERLKKALREFVSPDEHPHEREAAV
jgi:hypothetical protein